VHGEDDLVPEGGNLLVSFKVNAYLASGSMCSSLGCISEGISHKSKVCTNISMKLWTQGSAAVVLAAAAARPPRSTKSAFIVKVSKVAAAEGIAKQDQRE
jgi:hypothetical protein